jgi:uncharacterized membrane protein YphA (DoxX/SURF4 family)
MGRLVGIVIIIVAVLAIVDVWKSESGMEKRLLWTVVILLLPLIGALAWYAVSRKFIRF